MQNLVSDAPTNEYRVTSKTSVARNLQHSETFRADISVLRIASGLCHLVLKGGNLSGDLYKPVEKF